MQYLLNVCREKQLFPFKLDRPTSAKTGMKELFAQPKMKKDGTQSKVRICTLIVLHHGLLSMLFRKTFGR